ncbi:MAG: VOC family protein [Planctomycetota bacterium]
MPAARLEGRHLLLPGHGPGSPTLEVFSYRDMPPRGRRAIHEPGLGHLCFRVDDVAAARAAVLAHGGGALGEVVRHEVPGAGTVTWCYVTDPEGNGLELQRWDGDGVR